VAVPILRVENSAGTVKSDRSTQSASSRFAVPTLLEMPWKLFRARPIVGSLNLVVHLALAARVTSERLWVLRPYGVEGYEFALRSLFVAT
jgi:hypothetical protein